MGIIAGAVMCAVSLGLIVFIFVGGLSGIMMAVAGFFAFVLLLGGALLLLTPVWLKKLSGVRAVYVLTGERALIVQRKLLKVETCVFRPEELQKTELQVNDNGSGSIIMKYDVVQHSKTSYKGISGASGGIRRTTKHPQNPKVAEESVSTVTIPIPVGFLDILEVESVDRLFRQTLRLPPPVDRAPEEFLMPDQRVRD